MVFFHVGDQLITVTLIGWPFSVHPIIVARSLRWRGVKILKILSIFNEHPISYKEAVPCIKKNRTGLVKLKPNWTLFTVVVCHAGLLHIQTCWRTERGGGGGYDGPLQLSQAFSTANCVLFFNFAVSLGNLHIQAII